ncbi:MAG: aminopeptidase N, partial [Pseudomonadota bacterium]
MTNAYIKRRLDYQPSDFLITETKLNVTLDPDSTMVESKLRVTRNSAVKAKQDNALVLDGVDLTLKSVAMDEKPLTEGEDYIVSEEQLSILHPKDSFTLTVKNTISPKNNTSLEGLYFMQSFFCTQCEAEGFRKITYYLDRPDVLSTFWVTITAPANEYPYLLSNGNLVNSSQTDEMKSVTWYDPFPKPCYLFALVAGDFDVLEDTFTTKDLRNVSLQLFVEKGRKHQGQFALDSLKRAMKWDEERYGLVYDLDIYMIVAADFFNMGAMENKGLNVFNSKFVLAEPKTATDIDFFNIESIIAHEYFHNWTGNRVTCRDWFQLSLKEGLTVFRDQQFSADMASDLSTRISQVKTIRGHQFTEDAGPMSHPIRPDEVMEMNNFYTVTVYDKGAEVIRMLHTLLGEAGFVAGMKLYFERFDGQAVTCDDFVEAMQDANDEDLTHFKSWYSQSGTPQISIKRESVGDSTSFVFQQVTPKTADQDDKVPLYVPIRTEFLSKDTGSKRAISEGTRNIIVDSETAS